MMKVDGELAGRKSLVVAPLDEEQKLDSFEDEIRNIDKRDSMILPIDLMNI